MPQPLGVGIDLGLTLNPALALTLIPGCLRGLEIKRKIKIKSKKRWAPP